MKVSVQRWGNSLAVRIPKEIALETQLKAGSVVDLKLVDGKLVLEPLTAPVYRLEDLLAGITDENLHAEIGTSKPVGNESR